MRALPRVAMVATGGTIASTVQGRDGGYEPRLAAADLLETIRGSQVFANIDEMDFRSTPGFALTIDDVVQLSRMLHVKLEDPGIVGAVVTCGTAAMDEVSYLLDLLLDSAKPIVLTGAMLHASRLGYDGSRNLSDALRVAIDPTASGRGVMVTLGGEIHAARDVQKLHRTALAPLISWPAGPLGIADADKVVWIRPPRGRHSFGPIDPVGPVDIIKVVLGCDDRMVRAALTSGARGLVIEGMPGGGGVPLAMMCALREAIASHVPVIATSRSPFGRILSIAGGGSGPSDLAAAGAIPCGDLAPAKARLFLMCALAVTEDLSVIRELLTKVAP